MQGLTAVFSTVCGLMRLNSSVQALNWLHALRGRKSCDLRDLNWAGLQTQDDKDIEGRKAISGPNLDVNRVNGDNGVSVGGGRRPASRHM